MVFFDAVPKFPRKPKLHPLGTPAEGAFVKRRYPMLIKEAPDIAEQENRNDFHRDKDRILYSRAFRRMMHKTQVCFTGEMNEHLRTRLTHTLEVSQIARSIARAVGANEDLTEAIALGHDVGHTPFGHKGEEVLRDFLSGRDSKFAEYLEDRTSPVTIGFKHNYQSVRLLADLETGYSGEPGLNLTWPVLEGILKHSKMAYRGIDRPVYYEGICDNPDLHPDTEFSVTIEGQIVALADEIAQVCHDYEDAFEIHLVNRDLMIAATCDALKDGDLAFLKEHYPILNDIVDERGGRINQEFSKQFTSILIGYIISTSVTRVRGRMADYLRRYPNPADHHPLRERIASEKTILDGDPVFSFLREMQSRYIIHAYEISRENQKGRYVLRKLLKAYLGHPLQLPDTVLNWYTERCTIGAVQKALPPLPYGRPNVRYIDQNVFETLRDRISKDELFFRAICDYISTMTDRFAVSEYQKLYGTSFGETS